MTSNPIYQETTGEVYPSLAFTDTTTKTDKKTISIGDDKKLDTLFYLLNMRTLTAGHIKILVYTKSSMRTVYMALQSLADLGVIDFHSYSMGRGLGNLSRFYFLTKKGFRLTQCKMRKRLLIAETT